MHLPPCMGSTTVLTLPIWSPLSPDPLASVTVITMPGQPHHLPPSLETSIISPDLSTLSLIEPLFTSQPWHCVPSSIVTVVCFGFLLLRYESYTVLARFPLLWKCTLQNQLRERKVCFILQIVSLYEGKSEQELKLNHERVWLTGLFSLRSYTAQDHQSRGSNAHSGLGPATPIINQENSPQGCLQVNLMKALSHLRIPLLRWLACFTMVKYNRHKYYTVIHSSTQFSPI